jgi:hypothetical protein
MLIAPLQCAGYIGFGDAFGADQEITQAHGLLPSSDSEP